MVPGAVAPKRADLRPRLNVTSRAWAHITSVTDFFLAFPLKSDILIFDHACEEAD